MAVSLPLPTIPSLPPVVIFHRDSPTNRVVTLQVPTDGAVDSITFRIMMDDADHLAWLNRLPNARQVKEYLEFCPHFRYHPRADGFVAELVDLDARPLSEKLIKGAHAQAHRIRSDRMGTHGRRGLANVAPPFRGMLTRGGGR